MMKIYGLDFTSAPRKRKPITCVQAMLEGNSLHYEHIERLTRWPQFEAFLERQGPWIAGCDFPFGQPRRLITNLGWPADWAGYVETITHMTMTEFEQLLKAYRDQRQPGDKHHQRQTDEIAGAISPMMLYGVPVGRMFFRGAPRLWQAPVHVIPCRPHASDRYVVEVYPALITKRWLGDARYKTDTKAKQNDQQRDQRRTLIEVLRSDELRAVYGVNLIMEDADAEHLIDDPCGDDLDGLLCAIQAAWVWQQRSDHFGIPPDADPDEGWIADPSTTA